MADFIFLHHVDNGEHEGDSWDHYILRLKALGVFQGGSAIGEGATFRKIGRPAALSGNIGGFMRVSAEDLEHASRLLAGHPSFESGGTVEIRELPRD